MSISRNNNCETNFELMNEEELNSLFTDYGKPLNAPSANEMMYTSTLSAVDSELVSNQTTQTQGLVCIEDLTNEKKKLYRKLNTSLQFEEKSTHNNLGTIAEFHQLILKNNCQSLNDIYNHRQFKISMRKLAEIILFNQFTVEDFTQSEVQLRFKCNAMNLDYEKDTIKHLAMIPDTISLQDIQELVGTMAGKEYFATTNFKDVFKKIPGLFPAVEAALKINLKSKKKKEQPVELLNLIEKIKGYNVAYIYISLTDLEKTPEIVNDIKMAKKDEIEEVDRKIKRGRKALRRETDSDVTTSKTPLNLPSIIPSLSQPVAASSTLNVYGVFANTTSPNGPSLTPAEQFSPMIPQTTGNVIVSLETYQQLLAHLQKVNNELVMLSSILQEKDQRIIELENQLKNTSRPGMLP
jgi:hypothetical protein